MTHNYTTAETPKAGVSSANPQETASWTSTLTMSWMNDLMQRGAITPLTEDDTWPLATRDTVSALHDRFDTHWQAEKRTAHPRFHRALWYTFRHQLVSELILYCVYAGTLLLQPALIRSILKYLASDATGNDGYALATLLALVSILAATVIDFAQYLNMCTGCNAKSIVIDMVVRKTLTLSGFAKHETNTGDILTLAFVDAERVSVGFVYGHWVVLAPLMLLAAYLLIGVELGAIVGLAGGATTMFLMYVGYDSGRKAGETRRRLLSVQAHRFKLTNEVLQGIRVVKLNAWEGHLEAQLATVRDQELVLLKAYQTHYTFTSVVLYIAPGISLVACLLVYVALGNVLTAPVAFTALAYANVMRFPCTVFATAVTLTSETLASCDRLGAFLTSDEATTTCMATTQGPSSVQMTNAAFSWAAPASVPNVPPPTLRNLSFTLLPGSLTIVVGPVGSGKSSLVSTILGEMHQVSGQRSVCNRLSYVNQEAWIQHTTLRNNILFHNGFDADYYDAVLAACQLGPDLAMLPNGDATEIGERGINLSGGQKARVSLARGVYHRSADLYLLDDPLSALDVHVATAVFHECIRGLLRGKTTMLVLNSHYHFLPLADRVLILDDGAIVGDGTYESLKSTHAHLMNFTESTDAESTLDESTTKSVLMGPKKEPVSGLVEKEDRAQGAVSAATYKAYFGASGSNGLFVAVCIGVFFTVSQAVLVLTDWFMSYWASHTEMTASISSGYIYLGCALLSVLLVYGRSLLVLQIAVQCSQSLHAMLLRKVLHAPVSTFFDVTPIGRILNRFSNDLDQIDSQLPSFGLLVLQFLFQILAILVVCALSTPFILIAYIPIFYLFFKLQQFYNKSSSELKRLESISRSPVVTLVAEALSGLSTIRAFDKTDHVLAKQRDAIDHYMGLSFLYKCSARWFQMRLDWLSAGILAGVAFICVATKASIGLAAAGLTLTYASQLSGFLSKLSKMYSTVQNLMTSVERLRHYESLPTEDDDMMALLDVVDASWPTSGNLLFTNVSMRYRDHLDLVLKDVSFTVPAGAKVGIVGRTGSGKSSLVASLFRMVPIASGSIVLDGVDLGHVPVTTLRSRLTIIPQDPVLFSGSIRFNLDPSSALSDDEVWRVLKRVHLANAIGSLDNQVAERGSNFSVGQRQLLCIARALLRKTKVVVLDEATANIDLESDKRIQATIKECFVSVTMLIIAHRLHTIIDADRILVLDAGRVIEYDTPTALLTTAGGAFAKLAAQAQLQVATQDDIVSMS
ncbi:hypothetical protein SPRG_12376 [Saprolegnia parasitica CBS 223.65]|uniref:ATP-binding Cassette (ABC) Superfamily n=1 Tax=Saprolegnia parasitica (strain CBS 223.65) TaxID=695850 RepID=A0A067BTM4_SAPPC|nr:hypothetical protein SPRG_12376 [Saprolegnia parasitica CBS 223.65]KDO21874.1 hypothetical protein SPRG_12376 [Saprolegnia parasitica CBS 223.65]|eukprot:XP_012207429.1 hypothetical protein SPRG_12376 [Saprolegnia parasitica CBS 223.65]